MYMIAPHPDLSSIATARMTRPRVAYKFFNSRHLEAIKSLGSVRIGVPEDFRKEDGIKDGRNDPNEMTKIFNLGNAEHVITREFPLFPGDNFAPTHGGETSTIRGCGTRFISVFNCYMLCMSGSINIDMCRMMRKNFDCDMYYRIPDVGMFAAVISRAGGDTLNTGVVDWVVYDNNANESSDRAVLHQRPDIKHKQFSWQDEIRVMWESDAAATGFCLDVPEITSWIEIALNPA
jgi:hypothetical protein